MLTGLKSFWTTARTHWVWALVLLVAIAFFLAGPIRSLVSRVPVLNQLPGIRPAA